MPDLLKQATAQEKAGDLNAAVATLRRAYDAIARDTIIYSVTTFLRLPLYLQKAGRNEEAWAEFNRLLTEGYPNQMRGADQKAIDASQIYDKMRLALQRQKRHDEAIIYGVLSLLSMAQGLRGRERKEFMTRENVAAALEPLLKKAKRSEDLDRFVDVILGESDPAARIRELL